MVVNFRDLELDATTVREPVIDMKKVGTGNTAGQAHMAPDPASAAHQTAMTAP